MEKRRKINYSLITGTLIACMATTPVIAQTIHEKVTISPGKALSEAEESAISSAAAHVLRYIAKARGNIHAKKTNRAKADLQQALTLLQIIKAALPVAKVKDHIWVAQKHLDYESTREVTADLIPIEADLTELENIVPVDQARKHLQKSREYLKKGDKQAAKTELTAVGVALIDTEVALPLTSTKRDIAAAKALLAQNKLREADKALKLAEDGVQFMSSAVFAPVAQARNSLRQAAKDYASKDYTTAKADLRAAGTQLDKAARSADQTTRKEAARLKHTIDNLKNKMNQADTSTASTLTGLWQHSRALAKYEAEKASTDWHKSKNKGAAKANLIKAKLYLAYAETNQFINGKTTEVEAELDKTDTYLNQAAKTMDTKSQDRIKAMRIELQQIEAHAHDRGATMRLHYEKIRSDLLQSIHDL